MTLGTRVGIFGVAAALLIPGVGAAWKAASMKGDIFQKWNERVDLTVSGLSEIATRKLIAIQTAIRDVLMEGSGGFDPMQEPARLSPPMKEFLRLLTVRDRTPRRFGRLCRVGPQLLGADVLYSVGVILAALDFAKLPDRPVLGQWGVRLALLGLVGLVAGFADYAYLENRLAGAEILSQQHDENA